MGSKRFDNLSDLCRHRVTIEVACRQCGRARSLSPHALSMSGEPPNRSTAAIVARLKCSRCGAFDVKWWLRPPAR